MPDLENYAEGVRDGAAAHRREGVYNEQLFTDPDYRRGIQEGRAAAIDKEPAAMAEPPVHPRIANDRRSEATRRARQDLRQAYQRLDALPETGEETPEFLAANAAVGDTREALPWHKRLDIDFTRGRGAQVERAQVDEDTAEA